MAAGIGPVPGREMPRRIVEVNYFGAVELLNTWRPALAASDAARVVVITSNSATVVPAVPKRAVEALLAGDTSLVGAILAATTLVGIDVLMSLAKRQWPALDRPAVRGGRPPTVRDTRS